MIKTYGKRGVCRSAGSFPRWSTGKPQVVTRRKATGAGQKKEVYADPPTWNFRVQACDSNYITLKQIQIIDTLVAKFRKAHNATPRHDTFKTPGQASPNPSNFGDTWKYLCSKVWFKVWSEECKVQSVTCRV